MESEPFKHDPIDLSEPHIRLFRLLPNTDDGIVRLEIVNNIDLDARPAYRTLSYEWGHPKPMRNVSVNGKLFGIRENLYIFLERLLHANVGLSDIDLLWADALCVDQENIREKNHQVQQMADIYRRSQETLAWLGPSLGVDHERILSEGVKGKYKGIDKPTRTAQEEFRKTFALLTQSTYWTRMWIVQELALSSSIIIICGDFATSFDVLLGFQSQFGRQKRSSTPSKAFRHICQFFDNNGSVNTRDLLGTALHFNSQLCENELDKFYGLFGLCGNRGALQVDYKISIEDQFIETLENALTHTSPSIVHALAESRKIAFHVREGMISVRQSTAKVLTTEPHEASLGICIHHNDGTSLPRLTTQLEYRNRSLDKTFVWYIKKYTRAYDLYDFKPSIPSVRQCNCTSCSQCQFGTRQGAENLLYDRYFSHYDQRWMVDSHARFNTGNDIDTTLERQPQLNVLLHFENGQYLETEIWRGSDVKDVPDNEIIAFRDPYHEQWELNPDHMNLYCDAIRVPLISVLILLAHAQSIAPAIR